jgi:hypothetical protein
VLLLLLLLLGGWLQDWTMGVLALVSSGCLCVVQLVCAT